MARGSNVSANSPPGDTCAIRWNMSPAFSSFD
jgi:hypothetical protein